MARNEIHNVINALKTCARAYPELRTGQLIDNALHYWSLKIDRKIDLFYVEDESLVRLLLHYAAQAYKG